MFYFSFSLQHNLFISFQVTHSTVSALKKDFKCVTDGQNQWQGLFTEWIIIPSVSLYCMYYPTEQTVAGLLVLLADRAASVGLWDLHIGPWWFQLSEARRCYWLYVHACGAGENVFHARGDRRQEGALREPARGDRRRAVLDSFEQLQIDFQAKHICILKTVLRAIWVSCGMCALNRWLIFLELSCRNFSLLKLGSWALFSLLLLMQLTENHQDLVALVYQI